MYRPRTVAGGLVPRLGPFAAPNRKIVIPNPLARFASGVRDLLFAFPCPPRLTPPPSLFAPSIFCHPDRSGPAFSGARFLGAGSSSGGTVATSQPNRDRWDPTDQLSASLFAPSTSNPTTSPPLRKPRQARRLRPRVSWVRKRSLRTPCRRAAGHR